MLLLLEVLLLLGVCGRCCRLGAGEVTGRGLAGGARFRGVRGGHGSTR